MFASALLLTLGAAAVSAVPCTSKPGSTASSYPAVTAGAAASPNGTAGSNGTTAASSSSSSGSAVQCPVVLDGRVPAASALTAFDTDNGIFNPDYVKGNNLSWSDILLFPSDAGRSRFDDEGAHKAVEVTITNSSIFQEQYGFRRAGLQFANDTAEDSPGFVGQKTLHWSVRQDAQRALNLSHEYLNAWHERGDYNGNQLQFQVGKMIDLPDLAADAFKIFDKNSTLLWSTPVDATEWQNFAALMDIDANTVQIYYSLGSAALEAVTDVLSVDLSAAGQFQIGILKKPTGTADVTNSGFQEAPIEEGQIYGGLFVEDSTGGCISL